MIYMSFNGSDCNISHGCSILIKIVNKLTTGRLLCKTCLMMKSVFPVDFKQLGYGNQIAMLAIRALCRIVEYGKSPILGHVTASLVHHKRDYQSPVSCFCVRKFPSGF